MLDKNEITHHDIQELIRLDLVIAKEFSWLSKNHQRRAAILNRYLPPEDKVEIDPNQLSIQFPQ